MERVIRNKLCQESPTHAVEQALEKCHQCPSDQPCCMTSVIVSVLGLHGAAHRNEDTKVDSRHNNERPNQKRKVQKRYTGQASPRAFLGMAHVTRRDKRGKTNEDGWEETPMKAHTEVDEQHEK